MVSVITDVNDLVGKTISKIERLAESGSINDPYIRCLLFITEDVDIYGYELCGTNRCKYVHLADVCGDLADVIWSPILQAEEASYNSWDSRFGPAPADVRSEGSYTWTFCRFSTIKGSVVFRWHGASNGYYSEKVGLRKWLA